ncbi:DUF2125 domain-containing protein [Methylopila turkensis]|uniref:DUF2125 domain-containing protein n=1 Tax=Methylopila turkensis TaxID=1437816 RepID=A0A9W6JM96_9HYPH|nr:DUF2125 domain-containing protein [Methylopila turkensis]GLK80236.1 hypothetical protein GCM10008174_19770 [Methylopila turkensis]
MTSQDEPTKRASRSRWMIYLPTALLLLAAALWSVFWNVAAGRAEQAVDAWIAREATKGRVYACGSRRVEGYPFRIELVCDAPTMTAPGDGGPVVATAARFTGVAQIYDPRRIIGDLQGPVAFTDAAGGRADLSFATAQASAAAGSDNRFDRASIALASPRLTADGVEIGAARRVEVHMRRAPTSTDGVYDLAASADDVVSPFADALPVGSGPVSGELQLQAQGVPDLRPGPTSERLRAFAEAGGKLRVALARLTRGDVAAEAKGDVSLDTEGRVNGDLRLTARGVDGVVGDLLGGGRDDLLSSLLGAGAQMLGKPARLDDRPATAYRVRIDAGRIEIGPARLGRLPPAF